MTDSTLKIAPKGHYTHVESIAKIYAPKKIKHSISLKTLTLNLIIAG